MPEPAFTVTRVGCVPGRCAVGDCWFFGEVPVAAAKSSTVSAAMTVHIGLPLTRGWASCAVRRAIPIASALRWAGVRPSSWLPFFTPCASNHASSSARVAASRYPLIFAPPSPSCLPTLSLRFRCAAFGSRGKHLLCSFTSARHSGPAPCGPWAGERAITSPAISAGGRSTRSSSASSSFAMSEMPFMVRFPARRAAWADAVISGCSPRNADARTRVVASRRVSFSSSTRKSSGRVVPNTRDMCSAATVSAIRASMTASPRRAVSNLLSAGMSRIRVAAVRSFDSYRQASAVSASVTVASKAMSSSVVACALPVSPLRSLNPLLIWSSMAARPPRRMAPAGFSGLDIKGRSGRTQVRIGN